MLHDTLARPLRNLRLSVTDRCNLRCQYCMPEADYVWLPREDLLHFEEISTLVDVFLSLGVDQHSTHRRRAAAAARPRRAGPDALRQAGACRSRAHHQRHPARRSDRRVSQAAGLRRVTVSLDTLRRDRFVALARFDEARRASRQA